MSYEKWMWRNVEYECNPVLVKSNLRKDFYCPRSDGEQVN